MTRDQLVAGIGLGVPRTRRGEAWQLLVSTAATAATAGDTSTEEQLEQDYSCLKSQLTSHQHAILIGDTISLKMMMMMIM